MPPIRVLPTNRLFFEYALPKWLGRTFTFTCVGRVTLIGRPKFTPPLPPPIGCPGGRTVPDPGGRTPPPPPEGGREGGRTPPPPPEGGREGGRTPPPPPEGGREGGRTPPPPPWLPPPPEGGRAPPPPPPGRPPPRWLVAPSKAKI